MLKLFNASYAAGLRTNTANAEIQGDTMDYAKEGPGLSCWTVQYCSVHYFKLVVIACTHIIAPDSCFLSPCSLFQSPTFPEFHYRRRGHFLFKVLKEGKIIITTVNNGPT